MNPDNSLNKTIPEILFARLHNKQCTFLLILLWMQGFVYAQDPRQPSPPLRKATTINKANKLVQNITKPNSLILSPHQTLCDFTLTPANVASNPLSQIIQSLAGSGITISNIQTNLPASSDIYGSFSCGSAAKLGIESGLILTTGVIGNAKGPNIYSGISMDNTLPGNSLLDALTGGGIGYDASVVSFDVVSNTNKITFKYVFASEEYNEFVNDQYNDVFGFFISGPGITGTQNIAVLPGTNTAITINTVNNNLNSQYYLDNESEDVADPVRFDNLEYDGLTTVLTATATVVPGSTYRLTLAIEDVADEVYDAGVFIEGGSITAGSCNMTLSATPIDAACPTANNGSIDLAITNGVAPFNIKWSNNATSEDLNNLVPGNYTVTVTDASPCQKILQVTVSSSSSTFTPSVSIAANPAGAICAGTNVTFTATPTNGGPTPAYQWKLNGNNVGTNSTTYQNAALVNGDKITCVMTSVMACANPTAATSNQITISVTTAVAPSVTIAANPAGAICAGTNVTFTATPTHGGATPAYQWKLNGNNVGTNSTTYQNTALVNGDKITCVMTSALACANPTTATSNQITISVTTAVAPSVTIAANPAGAICAGTHVTFTATPINGGATPAFQWKLNGNNVGTNSTSYQNAALVNGDKITCAMSSALACANPTTATSNEITISVTTAVTPSVTIAANPAGAICAGTNITFTATPTNGGPTPAYQWKLNGNNVGTNSTTYQNAALVNGDKITCVMTSALACANPNTATSNEITISVTTAVTPSVTIGANPAGAICAGTNITFTATPTNGGTTPAYQWKLNGNNVGTNSTTFQNAALVNGDKITCVMTSALACANPTTATSNQITISVTTAVAPSVTIAANPDGAICAGTNITFTATPTNGGTTPIYQWKLNGNNVGTNSTTYQNAALVNGDKITCVMTSVMACANPTAATSNQITISVTTAVAPSVTIAANPAGAICAGTNVTFTATPTHGGATPAYQWKLNGNNVGTNSTTYQNAALVNGDKITCVMTSALACANPTTATSNEITISVTTAVAPSVTIAPNPAGAICAGTHVTFTATPINGGATPAFQWKLNGNNVGTNSTSYQNAALVNGDKITCAMSSALACANPTTATSNEITISVTTAVTPSVTIAANPAGAICAGTNITFTATPTNGGPTPAYQWKLNGNNVGTNSTTYQNAALVKGDKITCVMTSALACANPTTATSNQLTMEVTALLTFYGDLDGDGYGNSNSGTTQACIAPQGYVNNNTDCNDNNLSVNPTAAEVCGNGVDNNCNGQIDESCTNNGTPKIIPRLFFIKESNTRERQVDLKIYLSNSSDQTISVRYKTMSGTAYPGKDYQPAEGIIQFLPGIKVATITLFILGDLVPEKPEIFYIAFSDPVNVTIPGVKRSRAFIIDDDFKKGNLHLPIKSHPITHNKFFDDLGIKIPSLLHRNQPLMIKGVANAQISLQITDSRGATVAHLPRYTNNWIPGNLASGIYFYQLIYRNQKGELQRMTGKFFITD